MNYTMSEEAIENKKIANDENIETTAMTSALINILNKSELLSEEKIFSLIEPLRLEFSKYIKKDINMKEFHKKVIKSIKDYLMQEIAHERYRT